MTHIEIALGSITEQDVEAIVNSANTSLIMGDGVAAAILAVAGSEVEEEAMAQAPIAVGDVVVTGAGDLPMRYIIHVGVGGDVPPDIYECTRNALDKAEELEVASVAFPALGTGHAGIRPREAARGMCEALLDFVEESPHLSEIRIVLWDDEHFDPFDRALRRARRARRADGW